MIVELGMLDVGASGSSLSAHVTWEEAGRDPLDLHIHCSDPTALVRRAEAFLPACAIAAQHLGERRITVDAPVSPLLLEGLPVALAWTRYLSRSPRMPLELDLTVEAEAPAPRPARHGMFFSGGVDSLSTLRLNHRSVAPGHPHRISDLIYVTGFEEQSSSLALHQQQVVADHVGAELVVAETNLAALDTPERLLWQEFFYGSFLASLATALAGRFTRVTIAPSNGTIGSLKRVGSLPQLDTNFSTDLVQILHPHFHTSRLDRIEVIADWDVARRWLRPCSKQAGDQLNCGRCEKCVPTQIAIAAAGHDLRDFPAFGSRELDPDIVRSLRLFDADLMESITEVLLLRLETLGRNDLVDAIRDLREGAMTWSDWRDTTLQEITAVVPDGVGVQIVDLGQFDVPDPLGARPVVWHWSAPGSDSDQRAGLRAAIERERDAGATYVAFLSSAFWWFESYPWLGPLLAELGREVFSNDRVRIVELR